MTEEHKGLPVHGYQPQSEAKVALVNEFKQDEERLLRKLDAMVSALDVEPFGTALVKAEGAPIPYKYDERWLAVARTHFQEGYMALNRAVFQPQRIKLPEDDGNPPGRQTSPEIASLAGRLMNMSDEDIKDHVWLAGDTERFCADIRKLAASALGSVQE